MTVLKSQIDRSVNFVEQQLVGFIESRYVRKEDDYFICYLSSQSGCNRGCKFCHLTATKQMDFEDEVDSGFLFQAMEVMRHYLRGVNLDNHPRAKYMHYNFMARGEPLANKYLLANADKVLIPLGEFAVGQKLNPKFNISTIMPVTLKQSLTDVFKIITPTIYYSLYSVNDTFRDKWLPAAMPVNKALQLLKEYQDMTKKIVKIHHCFIKGENDSTDDVLAMVELLDTFGLKYEFNLVRYNPFSPEQGEETDEETIWDLLEIIEHSTDGKVQIIQRVGFDVKASCGMFVDKAVVDPEQKG